MRIALLQVGNALAEARSPDEIAEHREFLEHARSSRWVTGPRVLAGAVLVLVIGSAAGITTLSLMFAPFLTTPFLLPLRTRIALVVALALLVVLPVSMFVGDQGGWFYGPMAIISGLAIVFGELIYGPTRDHFMARLRLVRHDQHLTELNETLEERVQQEALAVRRLAQHLETLREDERKWMAREIHDELGQELTALRYAVAVARHEGGTTLTPAFDEIEGLLDRTRATMRRILAALRPRVLDELGLVAGLEWLAKDVGSRTGVVIQLEVSPSDLMLVGDGATTVFRIVQEALTNVARHANAKAAWVRVACQDAALTVTILDDGVGITEGQGREEGLGLIGIRERADAFGGEARWTRRDGGGTELWVRIPYPIERVEGRRSS